MPTNKLAEPAVDDWRRLYDAARKFMERAPWAVLPDDGLTAVELAEGNELAFCSAMGAGGIEYGLLAHLGARGVLAHSMIVEGAADGDELLLIQDCLAFSMASRSDLPPADRKVAADLGLAFRGANAWPLFSRYRPNLLPARLQRDEANMLADCLEQICALTEEVRAGRRPDGANGTHVVARLRDGAGGWRTGLAEVPELFLELEFDPAELAEIGRVLEKAPETWEVQVLALTQIRGEKGEADYWARLLLCVDAKSGIILSPNMLGPEDSIQEAFMEAIERAGYIPSAIRLTSVLLEQQLENIADALGIEIRPVSNLPKLKKASSQLRGQFGGTR